MAFLRGFVSVFNSEVSGAIVAWMLIGGVVMYFGVALIEWLHYGKWMWKR
jgi:hypothetical protein